MYKYWYIVLKGPVKGYDIGHRFWRVILDGV